MDGAFKCCGKCGKAWSLRTDFMRDPELILIGYQPTFGKAEEGLFLFTHVARDCGTTLALKVGDFEDLVSRSPELIKPAGVLVCPSHCLRVHDLQACNAPCHMRWVRQLIQVLRHQEVQVLATASVEFSLRVQQTA